MAHYRTKDMLIVTASCVAAVTIIAFLAWYYYRVDPSEGGGIKCMFKLLTGYDCPGCGAQRALHAMLHGDIAAAWHFNPMIFFAIPLALYYLVVEGFRNRWPRIHSVSVRPAAIITIFFIIIAYWIGRNI